MNFINLAIAITPVLVKLNLILAFTSVAILALSRAKFASSATKQRLARLAITTALLAPITASLASQYFAPSNIFQPPVQIGSTGSMESAQALKPIILTAQAPTTFSQSPHSRAPAFWFAINES